jgi:hypothetical protein
MPGEVAARFPRFYLPRDSTGQNMSGYLVAPSPLRAAVRARSPDPVPGLSAGCGAGTRAGSRGVNTCSVSAPHAAAGDTRGLSCAGEMLIEGSKHPPFQ